MRVSWSLSEGYGSLIDFNGVLWQFVALQQSVMTVFQPCVMAVCWRATGFYCDLVESNRLLCQFVELQPGFTAISSI
jgi:hypothetical protein